MQLKTVNLKRSFSNFTFEADIQAKEGEFVCLLGPSGCGKTTALQLIAGILAPDSGEIYLGRRRISDLPPWERRVGLVFQDYALFPHMTVEENIAYGLKQQGQSRDKIRTRVDELLSLVRLSAYHHRKPHELSGGEKQRVALARAIAPSPSLLLLDEPLSALDARLRIQLRREIREIQRRIQLTTIYVTHDQEEALSLSDRIIMLQNGKIEQTGSPQELYNDPRNLEVAQFIGNANLIARKAPGKNGSFYFFRPEDTFLMESPPENTDIFSEHLPVRSVEYIGSHYIVEGRSGETVIRAHLNEEDMEKLSCNIAGKKCWFTVDSKKLKILPK